MILKDNTLLELKTMAPKTTKRYEKKDPISHCLDRPDMYVGSTTST